MDNTMSFITGNENILDEIEELWEELNKLHLKKSPYFKSHYKKFTFAMRKEELKTYAKKGILFVIVAKIKEEKIGYCISSIKDNIGEIDSIYVKPTYQKKYVGNMLIEKSLEWLNSKKPEKIITNVSIGNENVINFYSKYGFKPRLTQLERKEKTLKNK